MTSGDSEEETACTQIPFNPVSYDGILKMENIVASNWFIPINSNNVSLSTTWGGSIFLRIN